MRYFFVSICVAIILSLSSVSTRLVNVQLISRHGIRAPNPVVIQLCPRNAANIKRYDAMSVDSGGLTGKGMVELYMLGSYTRREYVDTGFIGPNYRENEIFIQAVAEDRTMQSAVAWGQALFPPGTAPTDFLNQLPEPLPIYSIPDKKDNLLEARKAACSKKLKQDADVWDNGYGQHVWNEMQETIDSIGRLCGVNMNEIWKGSGDNYGDTIKDISDNLWFDQLSGFTPLDGLTLPLFASLRELAVRQLLGRILGTPQQVVYLNGDLPKQLVDNWRETLDGGHKMFAYHGHREMMYALASFFELDYNIPFPGLPHGGILPGGTVFIELHSNGPHEKPVSAPPGSKWYSVLPGDEHFVIRTYLWYPCYNTSGVNGNQLIMGSLNAEAHCPSHPINIAGCKNHDCPLPDVLKFIQNKVEKVGGDWAPLCALKPPQQLVDPSAAASLPPSHISVSSLFSTAFIFALLFTAFAVMMACAKQRRTITSETMGLDGQTHPQEHTQLLR